MKNKIIRSLSIIIALLIAFTLNVNAANTSKESYVYPYGSDVPLTHLNTSERVTVPSEYQYQLVEMRGVWVATVWNLDFPKAGTVETFKANYLKVLDNLQSYNVNTIFFQIRPCNDAFYKSELNPWSTFLKGSQGQGFADFDPLEWMIKVTHERHMEFQGWLNAYRVTVNGLFSDGFPDSEDAIKSTVTGAINNLDENNFARLNPDCVLLGKDDTKLILDPGNPKVINFIIETVKEIITNYDIDGVHFDDYFYLSGGFHSLYNDQNTYLENRVSSSQTLRSFREESVNKLIKGVSDAVRTHNAETGKDVEYGAKPAAVWQSSNKYCSAGEQTSPLGSNTTCYAYSSKYDLYADSKKWVDEGWVDYIAPQIYFNFENTEVPYADIVDWWAETVEKANENLEALGKKKVKLYIAHGTYRYDTTSAENQVPVKQFRKANEILTQLKYNQKYDVITGNALYDYTSLIRFSGGTTHEKAMEYLKEAWSTPALIPGNGKVNQMEVDDYYFSIRNNGYLLKIDFPKDSYACVIYKNSEFDKLIFNGEDYNYEIDRDNTYSIRVVDSGYNISEKETVLSYNKTIVNTAPTPVKITLDKDEYQVREYMTITIPLSTDNEKDLLTYTVYFVDKGREALVNVIKNENSYQATTYASGKGTYGGYFKVVISDGDKETICTSPLIYIEPVNVIIDDMITKSKSAINNIIK